MNCQSYLTTNSYVFYEEDNLYNLSRPQWLVGLGAGLGVGHSNKFKRIVQLVKYVQYSKNRINSAPAGSVHDWGETLEQGTDTPNCFLGAAQSAAHCSNLDGLNAENTSHCSLYSV